MQTRKTSLTTLAIVASLNPTITNSFEVKIMQNIPNTTLSSQIFYNTFGNETSPQKLIREPTQQSYYLDRQRSFPIDRVNKRFTYQGPQLPNSNTEYITNRRPDMGYRNQLKPTGTNIRKPKTLTSKQIRKINENNLKKSITFSQIINTMKNVLY